MDIEKRVNYTDKTLTLPHRIEHEGEQYVKSKRRDGRPVYYDGEDFVRHAFADQKVIECIIEEGETATFRYIRHYPGPENPAYVEFEYTHDATWENQTKQVLKTDCIVINHLWTGWEKDLGLSEYDNPFVIFPSYYRGRTQCGSLPFNEVSEIVAQVFGVSPVARVRVR